MLGEIPVEIPEGSELLAVATFFRDQKGELTMRMANVIDATDPLTPEQAGTRSAPASHRGGSRDDRAAIVSARGRPMIITATAHEWEHGWELHLNGSPATQVSTLDQAEQQVRDYLDTIDPDTDHSNWTVTIDVQNGPSTRA